MTVYAESKLDIPVGGDWMEIAPGERLAVRISSSETHGRYAALEVVAGPGCGPPLHIHQNEDEHFITLEGSESFVHGDRIFDATAGTAFTVEGRAACLGESVRNQYSDARNICTERP